MSPNAPRHPRLYSQTFQQPTTHVRIRADRQTRTRRKALHRVIFSQLSLSNDPAHKPPRCRLLLVACCLLTTRKRIDRSDESDARLPRHVRSRCEKDGRRHRGYVSLLSVCCAPCTMRDLGMHICHRHAVAAGASRLGTVYPWHRVVGPFCKRARLSEGGADHLTLHAKQRSFGSYGPTPRSPKAASKMPTPRAPPTNLALSVSGPTPQPMVRAPALGRNRFETFRPDMARLVGCTLGAPLSLPDWRAPSTNLVIEGVTGVAGGWPFAGRESGNFLPRLVEPCRRAWELYCRAPVRPGRVVLRDVERDKLRGRRR